MKSIGIICEFNPLHNGHVHFIEEIKKNYPDYVLILVLNGYFLERGEVSILSKEDKVKLSLEYNVDIVLELPVLFGTQSADTFAEVSIKILNNLKVEKLIFGSESNNIDDIFQIAKKQLYDKNYNEDVKKELKTGINYPSALAKALKTDDFVFTPNDLLGISYVKAILKNNFNIEPITLQRTNGFHDNDLESNIVSASNIREKIKEDKCIINCIPKDYTNIINTCDKEKYYEILKVKILTDPNLKGYLDVDEGIEHRLYEGVINTNSLDELIKYTKNKRYTYNKINRMLVHILLGITKEDAKKEMSYTKIIGFNKKGQEYIRNIKKDTALPLIVDKNDSIEQLEKRASIIYELLTNTKTSSFEHNSKPVVKKD
ncbi:MAG: nucleotidyltransferase [bacterium]